MAELFTRQETEGGDVAAPAAGSRWLRSGEQDWQPSSHEGFWIKPLLEDPGSGRRSWLMKMDPGAFSESHAHEELEQVYILEGSFYDEERSYHPGDYIVRAPGAMHTAGSKEGAVALVIYTPA